jgi:hypothetical protein
MIIDRQDQRLEGVALDLPLLAMSGFDKNSYQLSVISYQLKDLKPRQWPQTGLRF